MMRNLILVLFVSLTACGGASVRQPTSVVSPPMVTSEPDHTLEQQLAMLDCRCVPSETAVNRFHYLLYDLHKATDLPMEEIAEWTVRAQKTAKKYGKDITLLDLMETSRSLIILEPNYKRALASVVAQRVQ